MTNGRYAPAAEEPMVCRLTAGGKWIRTCMGLFLAPAPYSVCRSPWKEHFFETGPEPGDGKLAGRLPQDFDVKCHETSLENDRR